MNTLTKVALGSQGLNVSVQGLGCMGRTDFPGGTIYGTPDERGSIATIHRALYIMALSGQLRAIM